jgi:hypothetical protein
MTMPDHDQQGPTGGVTPHLTIHDGRCREAIRYGQVTDPFGHSWSIGASPKGAVQ